MGNGGDPGAGGHIGAVVYGAASATEKSNSYVQVVEQFFQQLQEGAIFNMPQTWVSVDGYLLPTLLLGAPKPGGRKGELFARPS